MLSYAALILCVVLIFSQTRLCTAMGLLLLGSLMVYPWQTTFAVLFFGGLWAYFTQYR